jgi:hypothetical protein
MGPCFSLFTGPMEPWAPSQAFHKFGFNLPSMQLVSFYVNSKQRSYSKPDLRFLPPPTTNGGDLFMLHDFRFSAALNAAGLFLM